MISIKIDNKTVDVFGLENHPDISSFTDSLNLDNTVQLADFLQEKCLHIHHDELDANIYYINKSIINDGDRVEIWCMVNHDDDIALLACAHQMLAFLRDSADADISHPETIRPDTVYTFTEVCPHCSTENEFTTPGSKLARFHVCKTCNHLIKPCTMCSGHACEHCPLGKDLDLVVNYG